MVVKCFPSALEDFVLLNSIFKCSCILFHLVSTAFVQLSIFVMPCPWFWPSNLGYQKNQSSLCKSSFEITELVGCFFFLFLLSGFCPLACNVLLTRQLDNYYPFLDLRFSSLHLLKLALFFDLSSGSLWRCMSKLSVAVIVWSILME